MTDLLDFVRHVGQNAGGTASALEILLRVTVLLLAAALVVLGLRRSSAALRHLVWALSLAGALLLPLCSWAFPAWHWAILPEPGSRRALGGLASCHKCLAPLLSHPTGESFAVAAMPPETVGKPSPKASPSLGKTAPAPLLPRWPPRVTRGPGRCFLPPLGPWEHFLVSFVSPRASWGHGTLPGGPALPRIRIGAVSSNSCSPRAAIAGR